ncbi:hypothetical protein IWX49DRAFT_222176 [Phyllosticta citricarpa]|uniref:Uncharacterized protein n=1 Tax=Phyllosticta citricarpa TaxID=55181 RepID=A0ABR1MNR5_9PEZI
MSATPVGSISTPAVPDGLAAHHAARDNAILSTSCVAPGFLQANLIVLPSRYTSDFRLLCKCNPVPCPLLAESADVGTFDELKSWVDGVAGESVARGIDIRKDAPQFMVYKLGGHTSLKEGT